MPLHRHIAEAEPPEKAHPWTIFLLYLYLVIQLVCTYISFISLRGNTKFYPRLYFGILVVLLTGVVLVGIVSTLVYFNRRLYARQQWQLWPFIFTAGHVWCLCMILSIIHIRRHGNDMGTQPFGTPGDLGSTFVSVHATIFATGLLMIGYSMSAIYAVALHMYKPERITLARRPVMSKRQ